MYVCIYVCMCVCMYVRMYVCTYVCMYVCMCVCIYVRTVQLTYKVKCTRELHASPSRVAREKLASAVVCVFLLTLAVSHLAIIISCRI